MPIVFCYLTLNESQKPVKLSILLQFQFTNRPDDIVTASQTEDSVVNKDGKRVKYTIINHELYDELKGKGTLYILTISNVCVCFIVLMPERQ